MPRDFIAALKRARQAVETHGTSASLDRARIALTTPSAAIPLERIFVRDGNAVVPLSLATIERLEAQDDYVMIYIEGRHYLAACELRISKRGLPNPPFLRVHRSHIVNLDHVDRMVSLDDARFEVRMKSGAKVPVEPRPVTGDTPACPLTELGG